MRVKSNMFSHQKISFVKSIVRIVGYNALFYSITVSVIILVIAEAIGIIEEIKES